MGERQRMDPQFSAPESEEDSTNRMVPAGQSTSRPVLEAVGLVKAFGGQTVLDGVDLVLRRGEVVLLRGENGSGKTTLLNILTGNLKPDAGTVTYLADESPRTYRFPRRWWQDLNPLDHFRPEFVARESIGRTWQDIRLFATQSLRDNISVADPRHPGENPILAILSPRRTAQREAEITSKAKAILARLGLAERENSSADMISLGQSKRVAIARAIAAGAEVLFLDEPLAGLDHQGIDDVIAMLQALLLERHLTIVIVEHIFNQAYFSNLVTCDWLLKDGRLKCSSPPVFHAATASASGPQQWPGWFRQLAGEHAEITDEVLPRGAVLTRIRSKEQRGSDVEPLLEIRNLIVKRGRRTVIGLDEQGEPNGFHLTLGRGEVCILQAPNGWGKTTLFDALAGLLQPTRGEICLDGQTCNGMPAPERVRRGLRTLPSHDNTFPSLTGKETLRLSGVPCTPKELLGIIARPAATYSGGEKKRLALASMRSGSVNLYDEPLSALDSAEPFIRHYLNGVDSGGSSLILTPNTQPVSGG